uniref:Copia protein n=1 Tax=Cajanus cajan TaxID=3821 RepID=A0A151RFP8_CAJCA|nr:Copia protein [Cajanus cajan]
MKLEHWTQAMKEEMNALEINSTWEIVDKPREKQAVRCRWIFTMKHKANGTIERYKARFMAKGYTQTYGIDYEETFSSVAKMNTVRVVLALAAHFGWDLHQLDVKNVFLHGNLEDEVYMEIPPEKLVLKEKLATQFEMKDIGKLRYFLGIEVVYSKKGIFISQKKYVLDLLKETGKLGCRTSTVPIEQNHKIGSEESAPVEKAQYQRLVGKLIYLSHTRPNIAYAMQLV